jgi:hypothetical protein
VIEILMIRDPDSNVSITVWNDGTDITDECLVVEVDAGAGWEHAEWLESAEATAASMASDTARYAVEAAYADPPGKRYIDGWPEDDQ